MMTAMLLALAVGTLLWLAWMWRRESARLGEPLTSRWLLAVALVPVLGLLVYLAAGYRQGTAEWLADYQTLRPVAERLAAGLPPEDLDRDVSPTALVRVLQRQLAITPSAEGWYALGLLYGELQAPEMAVLAARRALESAPQMLPARLLLAQGLIGEAEGRLTPEAQELLSGVLADDPEHDGARMLLGMAATQNRQYALAAEAWRALLARHADSEAGPVLQRSLDYAEAQQALAERFEVVNVTIEAPPELPPGGSLFVFLRVEGQRGQPLAARRVLVDSFPLTVALRGQDWLQPYPDAQASVEVGARYSAAAAGGVDQAERSAAPAALVAGQPVILSLPREP